MTTALVLSPSQPIDLSAIDRCSRLGPNTKFQYKRAIERMIEAGVKPGNIRQYVSYFNSLPTSSQAFLKAGLKVVSEEFILLLKSSANPGNVPEIQARIWNLEAFTQAAHARQWKGSRAHVWLTRKQVGEITARCDRDQQEGRRDWLLLSLMLGAGMRRDEVANMRFDWIRKQEDTHVIEVLGKGAKHRVVPIQGLLARYLLTWEKEIGNPLVMHHYTGKGRTRKLSPKRISGQGIRLIVKRYGELIGVPGLNPHDLRRSFAMIAYSSGKSIDEISILLGHSSIVTTRRYLDIKVDLVNTASGTIPLSE